MRRPGVHRERKCWSRCWILVWTSCTRLKTIGRGNWRVVWLQLDPAKHLEVEDLKFLPLRISLPKTTLPNHWKSSHVDRSCSRSHDWIAGGCGRSSDRPLLAQVQLPYDVGFDTVKKCPSWLYRSTPRGIKPPALPITLKPQADESLVSISQPYRKQDLPNLFSGTVGDDCGGLISDPLSVANYDREKGGFGTWFDVLSKSLSGKNGAEREAQ